MGVIPSTFPRSRVAEIVRKSKFSIEMAVPLVHYPKLGIMEGAGLRKLYLKDFRPYRSRQKLSRRRNPMQPSAIPPSGTWPWAPYRCPRCQRYDTIPMPSNTLWDMLLGWMRRAPFKCRACRAKFHRRPFDVSLYQTPWEAAVTPRAAGSHADPEEILRRLNHIIRNAENTGRRKE